LGIWYVNLRGERRDLEELAKRYRIANAEVIEKNDRYILISNLFDSLDSYDKVRNTAEDLIRKINGSMRLLWTGYGRVELESVANISDQGKVSVSVPIVLEIVEAPPEIQNGPDREGRNLLEIAEKNRSVSKLLSLFSHKLDWVTLYKISEVIYEDQGQGIIDKGWATPGEVSQFRATANCYRAIGDSARHAREKDQPPSAPMALGKAQALIRKIALRWLEEKSKS
jgi:hypothetical protein